MIELVEEKRDIGEKRMSEMRPLEVCAEGNRPCRYADCFVE